MSFAYADVLAELRAYYDAEASARDGRGKTPWKLAERAAFLERLVEEGRRTLVEIGAGAGADSAWFAEQGLKVVAVDQSAGMVEQCAAKGLDARRMDVLHLELPDSSFDAAFSINCFLHIPDADLGAALDGVRRVLAPGGLFYLGVYGGHDEETIRGRTSEGPGRFFASRSDARMVAAARDVFEVVDFHPVDLGEDEFHFQSLTLRA